MSFQPGEAQITYASVNKAKNILGWEPKTRIEEGMEKVIEWYKDERT